MNRELEDYEDDSMDDPYWEMDNPEYYEGTETQEKWWEV